MAYYLFSFESRDITSPLNAAELLYCVLDASLLPSLFVIGTRPLEARATVGLVSAFGDLLLDPEDFSVLIGTRVFDGDRGRGKELFESLIDTAARVFLTPLSKAISEGERSISRIVRLNDNIVALPGDFGDFLGVLEVTSTL